MFKLFARRVGAACVATAFLVGAAAAQNGKPLRIVVPFQIGRAHV